MYRNPFINLALLIVILSAAFGHVAESSTLKESLDNFRKHLKGQSILNAEELITETELLEKNLHLLETDESLIIESLEVVELYEKKRGPLFISKATQNGMPRKTKSGLEIDYAFFALQQGLLDYAYTPQNIRKYWRTFQDAKFETSTYFPGKVAPPEDSSVTHPVRINASQHEAWGKPVSGNENPARRPTGCYLAPGSIVEVHVPASMVDQGYSIRVGAQSWDLKKKPIIKRLDRVSLVYPITEEKTWIANPLGGGIYIEVPYLANAGIVTVHIKNAVRSPFFSAKSFHKTSLREWQEIERKHLGPWADFESEKFMMQVPTNWIYALDDPAKLMEDWDKAMDAVSELFGHPLIRPKTVLYTQVDVTMRGSANFPGYPQSNYPYKPSKDEKGNAKHWMVRGPEYADWTVFHEVGHSESFTKFRGEVEAVVNLPHVAVMNKKFGYDLDTAFGSSVGGKKQLSLEHVAAMWMVTENFRNGKQMNHSNRPGDEMKYQHRGYAKYVEIANLFGWEALEAFWKSVHEDYMKGIEYETNRDPTDNRILRMSIAANADLTPLIHFWGIQPENPKALADEMRRAKLSPSREIFDRLNHYKAAIPMDNDAFRQHTKLVFPKGLGKPRSLLYGEGWYSVWLPKYNESHGEAAQAALQALIDSYYPNGRPR
ncbi:MAG: M60 family metallopeptidase [Opitutaceae bacterium]